MAERAPDPTIPQDNLAWWFDRDFGRHEWTMQAILDMNSSQQGQLLNTMEDFFIYQWDKEILATRRLASRNRMRRVVVDWVEQQYVVYQERVDLGEDPAEILVSFDTFENADGG